MNKKTNKLNLTIIIKSVTSVDVTFFILMTNTSIK